MTNSIIKRVPVVELVDRKAVTTSFEVADYFKKLHYNVLRDIDVITKKQPDFAKLHFEVCYKINELQNSKPQKYYLMTRDGFTLLAMGFRGDKALAFKVAYIKAFEEQEKQLAQIKSGAVDVCKALGIQNASDALKALGFFDRARLNLGVGKPEVNAVTESGLYTLILRSRDAVKEGTPAYRFRVWVTTEVLPTIRKTGSYGRTPALPDFTNPAIAARAWAEEYEKNQKLQSQLLLERPKVEFTDKFLASNGKFLVRIVAKAFGMAPSKLWAWLKSHHYVSEKNEAYADPVKRGFLVVHVQNYERDGAQFSNCTTKIAPKGIYHFHKLLKRDGLIPPDNQINFEFLGEPA